MVHPRFLLAVCFLLFISFTSLYLVRAPDLAAQPWDSLAYTYSTEVDGIRSIWGNHPLGHVIFFTTFTLAKQLGYDGRSLTTSQITNGILGGMIIAIFFFALISIIKIRMQNALGFSLVLGSSYGFWFFAGTGDIYHFSILISLLAWILLAYEIIFAGYTFPFLSGILTGLAILSHQLNALLIPTGMVLILLGPDSGNQSKKVKIKQIAIFLGASIAMAFLGYLLLGFIATGSLSLARVIGWMRGYFGDPTYGRYLGAGSLMTAWLTISQAVLFDPQNTPVWLSSGILSLLGLMMLLGLWSNKVLDRKKRAILIASALECLLTWLLILWWEPQNPKFWLLTLIPWMIVLALSFEAIEIRIRNRLARFGIILGYIGKTVPFIIGIILLSINLRYTDNRADVAEFHEAMDIWLDNSNPDDVIITAGDLIPHLRYWGKRPNTIFLYRSLQASQDSTDSFHELRKQINQALCMHHTVLITPAASAYVPDSELSLVGVTREKLRSYLNETARQGEIAFWYRDVFDGKLLPVYALTGHEAC
jgi:hypothetical protein